MTTSPTAPAAAWQTDPSTEQAPDLRRANLAERSRINRDLGDAAQVLLSLRDWASPEEARSMISAIQSVAYGHAQIIDACEAHEAEQRSAHFPRQFRGSFLGLR
jgi:hypothetical protein